MRRTYLLPLLTAALLVAASRGLTLTKSVASPTHRSHSLTSRPTFVASRVRTTGAALAAQNAAHHPTAGSPHLSIAVNGADTPEAIPDDLAAYHFIKATAILDDAPEGDRRRRDSLLTRAGLSVQDKTAYVTAIMPTATALGQLAAERLTQKATRSAQSADVFRRREQQALSDARGRLRTALSGDGVARLERHLREHVKTGIVIYRGAPR